MSPDTATVIGMTAIAAIYQAPELLRIWAGDRKAARTHARQMAEKGGDK